MKKPLGRLADMDVMLDAQPADGRSDIVTALVFVFCLLLSIAAFGNRSVPMLGVLSAINALYLAKHGFPRSVLKRGALYFLSQSVVIAVLYMLRYGEAGAAWAGLKMSWQLFLAFLPPVIFIETTPQSRIIHTLSRIIPARSAFVIATCLKFLPLLLGDLKTIYEAQIMRGARLRPHDLYKPSNWPDFIRCMLVPAIIHALQLAAEIALAARARDFGIYKKRTCWPGE